VTQLMTMFPKLPGETVEHRENLPSELKISGFKFASVISQVKVRGVSQKKQAYVRVSVCMYVYVYIYHIHVCVYIYVQGRKVSYR